MAAKTLLYSHHRDFLSNWRAPSSAMPRRFVAGRMRLARFKRYRRATTSSSLTGKQTSARLKVQQTGSPQERPSHQRNSWDGLGPAIRRRWAERLNCSFRRFHPHHGSHSPDPPPRVVKADAGFGDIYPLEIRGAGTRYVTRPYFDEGELTLCQPRPASRLAPYARARGVVGGGKLLLPPFRLFQDRLLAHYAAQDNTTEFIWPDYAFATEVISFVKSRACRIFSRIAALTSFDALDYRGLPVPVI